ncbi:Crp/Fnr family transcriptional regulator [Limibaculum sp. M0105]|uniref:Crp/Fnr family transcriptional regulator n=1 Tax=Thermohalobaculum xanthum TaxID=2753746 RepID=A0A8J7M515_9RHOB|nr:Crp/Fnr family transcriptional regulator [Thermohalobaculum xanthum]MBK0398459.1 Crp/Fnr family transcriptional regulator [Thermohalobaculum xanthum]
MSETIEQALERAAPGLSDRLRKAIAARASRVRVHDGHRLFGPGDRSENFLIALSGAVRVEHMGPSGRSVVLYRVAPGESCVMTTSCLLSGAAYEAYGYAEGEVEAIAVPAVAFRELVEQEAAFRDLALSVFSQRIIELVDVIDELLLHRVDLRLASWLADRAPAGGVIAATHQSIASELGTAREVVSRILKEFERRGWLKLTRGEIRVADPGSLQVFSATR